MRGADDVVSRIVCADEKLVKHKQANKQKQIKLNFIFTITFYDAMVAGKIKFYCVIMFSIPGS
jgi:hypothetical protein